MKVPYCLAPLNLDSEELLQLVTREVCVCEAAHPPITLKERNAEHSACMLLSLSPISRDVQFFNPHDTSGSLCWPSLGEVSCEGRPSIGWDVPALSLPRHPLWILLGLLLPVHFIPKLRLRKSQGPSQGQPGWLVSIRLVPRSLDTKFTICPHSP